MPDQTCECAREDDPGFPQVLHLLNNVCVLYKVCSPKGRIAIWQKAGKSPEEITESIRLATLSRRPTDKEREDVAKFLKAAATRQIGFQDLQHALMNLNEFPLRHRFFSLYRWVSYAPHDGPPRTRVRRHLGGC